jgi:hypothetical protein
LPGFTKATGIQTGRLLMFGQGTSTLFFVNNWMQTRTR